MKDIIITNQERLETIKQRIIANGPEKLHVVSDFDKTLTACFVNGEKIASLISVLRDEKYLTPDYSGKAQALYDKYHPIEINPNIFLDKKIKMMHEWWSTHYELLIKSGLKKNDLEKLVQSKRLLLRSGAMEFFDFLNNNNILLLILSSAGVGAETIRLYLKKFNKLYSNIHIVSNEFIWNEKGEAIGVREPIIHTFNKNYKFVESFLYQDLSKKKDIILLGNGIGDTNIVEGFDYDNIIKIGFLNENIEENLEEFKNVYDVIILNDGPMHFVNKLLIELVLNK